MLKYDALYYIQSIYGITVTIEFGIFHLSTVTDDYDVTAAL